MTVDQRLGNGVDRLIGAHHRRRLHRHGWERALDAPAGGWAAGDPPPRPGNRVEVLVDGATAFACPHRRLASGAIDERWRPIAQDQLQRSRGGRPVTHRLIELPGVSKRTDRLRGPLGGLLADG